MTASNHPGLARRLFHNIPEDKLQNYWNSSQKYSKVSALGQPTQLLLRVTELLLDLYICILAEDTHKIANGTFGEAPLVGTTNVNA